jgi:hypothetical protein
MKKVVWLTAIVTYTLLANATGARAQLPLQLSFNAGLAMPVSDEADAFDQGFHVGAGLKVILIPLQLEGALDRFSPIGAGDKLTVLSAALTLPISVTPPLSPVGIYFVAGGGLYNLRAETKTTDVGITGGAGVRINVPFLKPFAEARGVAVFAEENKFTYVTLTVGLRF